MEDKKIQLNGATWCYRKISDGVAILDMSGIAESEIVIPAFIEDDPVVELGCGIGDFIFEEGDRDRIESVVIPEGVIRIVGGGVFSNCKRLQTVTLPSSLNRIWEGCASSRPHSRCFPGHILYGSFSGCPQLRKFEVTAANNAFVSDGPALYSHDGRCLIAWPSAINVHDLPKSVRIIGTSAFSGSLIEEIDIPSMVELVDEYAFIGCKCLKKIHIEGRPDIGRSAFEGCGAVSELSFSADSVGKGAFHGCHSLKRVTIDAYHIANAAFEGCQNLECVTISGNGVSIDSRAFAHCPMLSVMNLGEGVVSIGEEVFSGDSSIVDMRLPQSVKSVGERAFADCKQLSSCMVEGIDTQFGPLVFWNCDVLRELRCSQDKMLPYARFMNLQCGMRAAILACSRDKKEVCRYLGITEFWDLKGRFVGYFLRGLGLFDVRGIYKGRIQYDSEHIVVRNDHDVIVGEGEVVKDGCVGYEGDDYWCSCWGSIGVKVNSAMTAMSSRSESEWIVFEGDRDVEDKLGCMAVVYEIGGVPIGKAYCSHECWEEGAAGGFVLWFEEICQK